MVHGVDYDFCMSAKLTAEDLLNWLEFPPFVYGSCDNYLDRNWMVVDNAIRVSCELKDFDRWANSEEGWYDIKKNSERREFVKFIMELRNAN